MPRRRSLLIAYRLHDNMPDHIGGKSAALATSSFAWTETPFAWTEASAVAVTWLCACRGLRPRHAHLLKWASGEGPRPLPAGPHESRWPARIPLARTNVVALRWLPVRMPLSRVHIVQDGPCSTEASR